MPGFAIARVYEIEQGKNYDPNTNGNIALVFQGDSVAGSSSIVFSETEAILDKIAEIQENGGRPVVSAAGKSGRSGIVTAGPTSITLGNSSTDSVSRTYYLYDGSRPSNLDAIIQGFHVIAPPGTVSLVTADNDEILLPSGSLVVGGVYDYSISRVSYLQNAGSIIGLAPSYYV